MLEKNRQWRAKNRLRRNQHENRRRALKINATVEPVDFDAIYEMDKGICYLCGNPTTNETLSFDHVIPLSRKGSHSMDNLRVAHKVCNSRKGNRLLEELDMKLFTVKWEDQLGVAF